jgi:hypothetical protein
MPSVTRVIKAEAYRAWRSLRNYRFDVSGVSHGNSLALGPAAVPLQS